MPIIHYGDQQYFLITKVLQEVGKAIRTLLIGSQSTGVPSFVFDQTRSKCALYEVDVTAFSSLHEPKLSLDSYGDEQTPNYVKDVSGLRTFLESLNCLEHLSLNLPNSLRDVPLLYTYDKVFGRKKSWPTLRLFRIQGIAVNALGLCCLVHERMQEEGS